MAETSATIPAAVVAPMSQSGTSDIVEDIKFVKLLEELFF
jgi:hypothetical protein